jgi:aminopeptidase
VRDQRLVELAKMLLSHSVKLQKGEKVLIRGHYISKPLMKELVREAYNLNAFPFVEIMDDEIMKEVHIGFEREQLEIMAAWQLKRYEDVDAVVSIYGEENDAELAEIAPEKHQLRGEVFKPVQKFIISERRWVLLNYPTFGLAQKAKMSLDNFEDYLLDVCTVDYEKLNKAMQPLKELMDRTDKVRLVSPGTDLTFSIKGIPTIICAGENNVPDGEVFTAPVRDSVNGTITYNTPCPYQGVTFNNVCLTFKDGKIVEATADQSERINKIFDTDEGARYVGEFAIGVNPQIMNPMGDILFDEKIAGSIHFTPGEAYSDADNGNKSAIHWDMVLIQRPEFGGGDIYFDDVLIRKDGQFVLPELESLNPENFNTK